MITKMRQLVSRSLIATCVVGTVILSGPVSAAAMSPSPDAPQLEESPALAQENWDAAVSGTDPDEAIIRFDKDRFIEQLGEQESDEDDVIVLETDILFESNSLEFPVAAAAKLEDSVLDVP